MSVLDVHTEADLIRQVAVAALDLVGDEDGLLGAPDRSLVTPGLPVDDCCEQIAVHVGPIRRRQTVARGRVGRNAWRSEVEFTVTVGRCIPGPDDRGNGPTVEQLEESARQINADGWALWNAVNNAYRDGIILGGCDPVDIGPMVDRNPSGGCGGWTLPIVAVVNGFTDDESS